MSSSPTPSNPPSLRRIGPGVAGLLSVLVYLSLPLVPLVGLVLALLAPLPLLQVTASGRPSFMAWGWVAVVGTGGALLTSSTWLAVLTLGYLATTAWPAVSVESWRRRGWSEGRWLAILVLVGLLISLSALSAILYPAFPPQRLGEMIAASLEQAGIPSGLYGLGSGTREIGAAFGLVAYIVPALSALYLTLLGRFLGARLSVLGLDTARGPFCDYRSEEWLPVGFILGGLGWVFLPEPGKWLAANLLVTVAGLYFVHGLAIIHFYLGPRLRHNRWVRAGVLLVALQMPVAATVAAAGLADAFVRLRRSGKPDEGRA
ncbi:MAG: DUF2232 domain-containing protein [Thermoanaerobaculaceae bacterium]|nr:DUF2232 domain-containing protein [Thermoanaerobaculaceae bacterium]MDI9621007.1 DUF2232 domain-containing protein [Acidobacteriota bacterium]NLH12680.1 DUF2232 domain-containing protein [Holophagae bacterium]HPW55878.1 DUF2232 domain-containing protein [Thermoanaerobaculaceae bacterium]